MKRLMAVLISLLLVVIVTGCVNKGGFSRYEIRKNSNHGTEISGPDIKEKLSVISGSENSELEDIMLEFTKKTKIGLSITYKGSIDIMNELKSANTGYDVVWPANSLWINMGDEQRRVKDIKSTSVTPVVFGIKKNLAQSLGFIGKKVSVKDILDAINQKKLKFCMTSATQSNSGACAYLGFLYALAGNPDILKSSDLDNAQLQEDIRNLLSGVNRSSGSSDWLKSLFIQSDYDAMVNYESLIINANQELEQKGKEPLYVIYPYDGLSLADSPIGFISKGNSKDQKDKESAFKEFSDYITSEAVQDKIQKKGRRTDANKVNSENSNVFNKNWGIDTTSVLSPIKMPSGEVITKALNLYQTELKKPSLNIYCLDYSGSMKGEGQKQLLKAMEQLLVQSNAKQYMLQAGKQEINIVIPFSDKLFNELSETGNDNDSLLKLYDNVKAIYANGGTDIFSPAIKGLELLKGYDLSKYSPAIILMTDGESNTGKGFSDFKKAYDKANIDVPVFSIMFGSASDEQLKQLADYTKGKVFDGREDLISAFKSVKGYN